MSKSETQVIVEPSPREEPANIAPVTVVEMSHRAVAAVPSRRSGFDDPEPRLRDPAIELDVAVVGAGPYGLSVAAHLAGHCRVRVFGKPMRTWTDQMPRDMLLRSDWDNTNLAAPNRAGTLDRWITTTGEPRLEPLPLTHFLRYAAWFQEQFVPEIDEATIVRVNLVDDCFRLITNDGRELWASTVVVAPGVTPFAYLPEVFRRVEHPSIYPAVDLPPAETFAGLRVAVVGAGQNGLEAAYRIHLGGAARLDVIARSEVHWFADREPHHERSRLGAALYRAAYPIVGFGPPPMNRLVLHPNWFARLPESTRQWLNARILRAGGSPWLREHLEGAVTFREHATVHAVDVDGDCLRLALSDGSHLEVDRLVVACGFRFDLGRLDFLAPAIRDRIRVSPATGWPELSGGLETTCPGFYFAGYPAEGTFGPLSRFVEGTRFAAEQCSSAVLTGTKQTAAS